MTDARRRRIEELLSRTATLGEGERRAWLDRECAGDAALRLEVEAALEGTVTAGEATVVSSPGEMPRTVVAEGGRIGPYRLCERLGEGGMGVVYRAEQLEPIRRDVALKVMKPGMDSQRVLARFEAERQALALMGHPNIARVLDAGSTPRGHPYFVMEYAAGVPLGEYCDRRRLDLRRRLELFLDVCDGIQHAHQRGIIHRDLKPSNILVQERDGTAEVKIIDFGIARAVDQRLTDLTLVTQIGQLVGTPAYMSPEQADPTSVDIDTRTDVYSLGVVLYELLTGRLPLEPARFSGRGFDTMVRLIREGETVRPSRRVEGGEADDAAIAASRGTSPSALRRALAGELDWIAMRALEKDRARRYGTVAALAEDVRRHLRHEPVLAGPPTASYRARKFVRRHRVGVAVSAALALSLIAGAALATVGLLRAVRAERSARLEAETSSEVVDFLVGLFQISDPGEARGNEVTARQILDRGVESIDAELTDRPELRGRLMETMGIVYRSLGLYSDATPLLEAAVEDRRRAFGEDSPQVAESLNRLAGLLLLQRRADEALPILEQAREIQERTLPEDDLARAGTLNNLGTVARLQRRPEDALAYYLRALEIRKAALGAEDPALIGALSNIASLQRGQGDVEGALAHYRRALAIAEGQLGPDHPDTAKVLNNLAYLYGQLGRHEEARPILVRVLAAREKTLGARHPELVTTLVNLGETCLALGDDACAAESFGRAVTEAEGVFAPDHERVLVALRGLVEALPRLGREDEARALAARLGAVEGGP